MSDQHHHRSLFSSKNRPFKGKSKGKAEKLNRGKVDDKSHLASGRSNSSASRSSVNATNFSSNTPGAHRIPLKHSIELGSKDARALRAKQLQRNAREQLFQKKRIGNRQGPPKIIALVPLGGSVDVLKIVQAVQAYADGTQEGVKEEMKKVEKSTNPLLSTIAVNMSGRQRRITLYATPRDTNAVLDIAKVADIVMFVVGTAPAQANGGAQQQQEDIDVDAFGTHVLAILKAQGMPACMGMQVGTASAAPKKQAALRKLAGRFFDTACGEGTKLIQMDGVADAAGFFRWIAADVKLKPIAWRDARPYMLAEHVGFEQHQVTPSLFSFTPAGAQPAASATPAASSEATGTLRIRGYLRGENPLQASQLVHLTGFGDFQIEKVEGRIEEAQVYQTEKTKAKSRAASKAASKMGSRRGSVGGADDEDMADATSPSPVAAAAAASSSSLTQSSLNSSDVVLVTSSPSTQESLLSLNPIDPLATVTGEQSWIGEEEYEHDGTHEEEKVGEGMEEDQEMGEDEERKAYDMDDDDDDDAGMRDVDQSGRTIESGRRKKFADQEIRPAITARQLRASSKPGALIRSQVAWDAAVPDDNDGGAEDREADEAFGDAGDADMQPDTFLQKKKLERDEVDFPDEVEFPMDTRCKERFARYRGLKSFLHSTWDSKENLPAEYAQIFQFANFEASKNRVLKDAILAGAGDAMGEEGESVVLGQRFYPVTIYLKDVPVSVAQVVCTTLSPICAFGVFKYEHKVSLLHFSIKRMEEYQAPIKAKEPMEFHVAFRRFVARPIYSAEGKGEKSMTKRFFHRGDFLVASVYGRIVFPPASVICFKPNQEISTLMVQTPEERVPGQLQKAMLPVALTQTATPYTPIVASGTLLSVNPDRLLIKRILLTGTPISVHKRNAVVRHMFFNADDVRWFQPVELTTKYGLVGHVKESRGTKGYMKCEFDKFIKQNDTVCMALYKRQYPPWNEELFAGHL